MTDGEAIAAVLLVAGPVIGAAPVAYPPLIPVWSMSREDHIRTVGRHRRAWLMLNVGFGLATVATSAGLLIIALSAPAGSSRSAGLSVAFVAYVLGGSLWLMVLAARARTTPALADLLAQETDPGPAETLLGAATSGMFEGFVVATSVALIVLGATLLLAGGIAAPVAALIALGGLGGMAWLTIAGDVIPAALYLPTILLGLAFAIGWS